MAFGEILLPLTSDAPGLLLTPAFSNVKKKPDSEQVLQGNFKYSVGKNVCNLKISSEFS